MVARMSAGESQDQHKCQIDRRGHDDHSGFTSRARARVALTHKIVTDHIHDAEISVVVVGEHASNLMAHALGNGVNA